jgi:sulfur transfer protein SufE
VSRYVTQPRARLPFFALVAAHEPFLDAARDNGLEQLVAQIKSAAHSTADGRRP